MPGLLALAMVATVSSATPIAPIGAGDSLTLPAARHVVRIETPRGPVWLLAIQLDGANGHGLVMYRSDDEGQTFSYAAPIQDDVSERDTADLLAVGLDVALVYSFEAPRLTGSERHDVYFQWWRYDGSGWTPQPALKVFDSLDASQAYSRAELAIDSLGRIWVQAFFWKPDQTNALVLSVSGDGGATFQRQPDLDSVPGRGGGRLISLGAKLMMLYGMHGTLSARMALRNDADPLGVWQAPTQAFAEGDGIYHGAALSAVGDGAGGLHLVYKNANDQRVYYRHSDGTTFGPATLIDDASDWALQPTTTRVGAAVAIYFNPVVATNTSYRMALRWLTPGGFTPTVVLTDAGDFKGYPAAPAELPASVARVPCFFSETPSATLGGEEMLISTPNPPH